MPRSRIFLSVFVVASHWLLFSSVWAQDFPVRPLRLVTIFAPGAAADQHARYIASKFSEQLGQPVLVDNKPGAGGLIGTRDVLRAQPPGYSLLLTNPSMVGNTFAFREPGYRLEDFTPVGVMGQTYYGMMVHSSAPGKTLTELVAHAKANPGKLNYGSSGNATAPHLTTEMLKVETGIDIVHIPFKGAGPAMMEFLGGRVDIYFDSLTIMKQNLSSGRYRILGIATKKRSPLAPEIPTLDEGGVKGFESVGWFGVLAPAGTPQPVTDKLSREISTIIRDGEMQKRLRDMGLDPVGSTGAEFRDYMKQEFTQWGRIVKAANIKSD